MKSKLSTNATRLVSCPGVTFSRRVTPEYYSNGASQNASLDNLQQAIAHTTNGDFVVRDQLIGYSAAKTCRGVMHSS